MKRKRKVKVGRLVVVGVSILLLCLLGYQLLSSKSPKGTITFVQDNVTIEYGSEVKSEILVKSVDGEITNYPIIDTKTLGKQELVFVVMKDGEEEKISFTIEVTATQGPIISFKQDQVKLKRGSDVDVTTYIKKVYEPAGEALTLSDGELKNNTYTVDSDVDVQKAGTYTLKVNAMSANGIKAEASLSVEVVDDLHAAMLNGNDIKEATYIKDILIVNKEYGLPSDFGGQDETASTALSQLQAGASAAGFDMPMLSGFRNYEYQVGLYNNYIERDGQAMADRYSARPGYSEHQTGLCFDVGAIDNNYGETAAGKWLAQHAADYGFIIRFPEGKEDITGYMYEPWHIRYVGKDVANEIYQLGVTLEEYLGVAD